MKLIVKCKRTNRTKTSDVIFSAYVLHYSAVYYYKQNIARVISRHCVSIGKYSYIKNSNKVFQLLKLRVYARPITRHISVHYTYIKHYTRNILIQYERMNLRLDCITMALIKCHNYCWVIRVITRILPMLLLANL